MGQSERFLMVLQLSGELGSEPRFGSLSTVLLPIVQTSRLLAGTLPVTRSSSPRPQPPQQGQAQCLICGRTVPPGARLWCSSHRGGWPCMCGHRGGVTVQGWHAAQPEVKGRCGWTDTSGTAASLYLQEGAGSPLLSPCPSPLGRPCVRQRFWEDCTRQATLVELDS